MAGTEVQIRNEKPTSTYAGGTYNDRGNEVKDHDWGNIAVLNTGTHPVVNFAFMIRVEGVFDLPCKSVKGFTKENEFDYIQEGGLNDYVHMRRKPISKPFTLQVERYVGVDYVDPLPLGVELVLPVILFVNKYCYPTFRPVATYTFTGCTVISKTTGELNAEASGLFVETITIAYREMAVVKIPSEAYDSSMKTWSFLDSSNKFGGKKGNSEFHRLQAPSNKEYSDSNPVGEKSRQQMVDLAESNVYEINTKEGVGRHSSSVEKHDKQTRTEASAKTKAEMETAANKNVYTINNTADGRYTPTKTQVHKKYTRTEKSGKTLKEMETAADANVYTLNKTESGRYSPTDVQKHQVVKFNDKSIKSKKQMADEAVKWNPSKELTLGYIDPDTREGNKDINGSADHRRETWDKAARVNQADENKFDIKKEPSADNGKAKRNERSDREPALKTMEKLADDNRHPTVLHAKKRNYAETKEPRKWPAVKSAQTIVDVLKRK